MAYDNRGVAYNRKASMTAPSPISIRPSASTRNSRCAYYNRGVAYNGKGEYDRAIADLDQAIRLDPKFAIAYMQPRLRL